MAKITITPPEGSISTQILWLDNGCMVTTYFPASEGSLERSEHSVFVDKDSLTAYIGHLFGAKG